MQIGESFSGDGVNAAHVNTVLGAKDGEARKYTLPNGSIQKVTLIKAVPYH